MHKSRSPPPCRLVLHSDRVVSGLARFTAQLIAAHLILAHGHVNMCPRCKVRQSDACGRHENKLCDIRRQIACMRNGDEQIRRNRCHSERLLLFKAQDGRGRRKQEPKKFLAGKFV